MSFRPKPQDEDVAALEVKIVPWDHGSSKETINIDLYFLTRLASESRELSHHYESLDIDVKAQGKEKRKRPDDSPEQSSRRDSRKPWALETREIQCGLLFEGAIKNRYRIQRVEVSMENTTD
jgi:hypothetical protein